MTMVPGCDWASRFQLPSTSLELILLGQRGHNNSRPVTELDIIKSIVHTRRDNSQFDVVVKDRFLLARSSDT